MLIHRTHIRIGCISTVFLALAAGCNSVGHHAVSKKANPLVTMSDRARCDEFPNIFAGFPGLPNGLAIKTVANPGGVQMASNQWRPQNLPQGPDLPAHCIVTGVMDQRIGTDGKPYETRFELRLPNNWTGRLLYQGGGGNDGVVNLATGRNSGSLGDYGSALSKGYAAVTTDAGHQGTSADFGLEHQARIDKAYAAHDRVSRTAKALIASYYGKAVGHSYFLGCSGGGRQGMMFAQRYPDYFDGVISIAPAMSVSSRATAAAAWDTQLFLNIAPKDSAGKPILSRAFSPSDLNLVSKAIVQSCDAQDGLSDGMVNKVKACKFDPAVLQCATGKSESCLSSDQVSALQSAFRGPVDASGKAVYTTQPWDPGIAAPGWRGWKLGNSPTSANDANNVRLMGSALGMVFATPADPNLNTANFDVNRDFAKFAAFSKEYDTFRDDKMQPFFDRGNKFMIVHGMADGIFSADESIDYFERLAKNHGGLTSVQAKARLFLVPGMNHCSGGPSTDSMDAIQAMTDWVEKGKVPDQIIAKALPNHSQFPLRSRPLCPYPKYARYNGSGSIEVAESFQCVID
jgi:pimeloyl-ACP methyl ester carboxylesterase